MRHFYKFTYSIFVHIAQLEELVCYFIFHIFVIRKSPHLPDEIKQNLMQKILLI